MRAEKDYYNLKVLIKLLVLDKSLEDVEFSPGNINVETLKRAIAENNYYELSEQTGIAYHGISLICTCLERTGEIKKIYNRIKKTKILKVVLSDNFNDAKEEQSEVSK
jgi:hypothetical protein